jgi:hypothetical protein
LRCTYDAPPSRPFEADAVRRADAEHLGVAEDVAAEAIRSRRLAGEDELVQGQERIVQQRVRLRRNGL